MTISGVSEAAGSVQAQMPQSGNDPVSKELERQIAEAKQAMQELSTVEGKSPEEKMQERQELQKKITSLEQQLRQHQIEQRKEQQSAKNEVDELTGADRLKNQDGDEAVFSKEGMNALVSADSAMKQAKVQGRVSRQLDAQAKTLRTEIKLDGGRGNAEAKENALADLEQRAAGAMQAQGKTLAEAAQKLRETSEKENEQEEKELMVTEEEKEQAEEMKVEEMVAAGEEEV